MRVYEHLHVSTVNYTTQALMCWMRTFSTGQNQTHVTLIHAMWKSMRISHMQIQHINSPMQMFECTCTCTHGVPHTYTHNKYIVLNASFLFHHYLMSRLAFSLCAVCFLFHLPFLSIPCKSISLTSVQAFLVTPSAHCIRCMLAWCIM